MVIIRKLIILNVDKQCTYERGVNLSKVVFLNIPSFGHNHRTLAIVKELIDRGEEVVYYSYDRFEDKLKNLGATYKTIYSTTLHDIKEEKLVEFPILANALMTRTKSVLEPLLLEIKEEKPDYIIHDSLAAWGKYIGKILNIPTICSTTTFLFDKKSMSISKTFISLIPQIINGDYKYFLNASKIQKELAKKYKFKKFPLQDVFTNTESLNIIYTSRYFQPRGEEFNDEYIFVGPCFLEEKEVSDIIFENIKNKIIYITFGTILFNNKDFFEKCFDAFKDMDVTVILSVGEKIDINSLNSIPKNFIVRNHVPQLEVLKRADLMISHGGMNSIQEALYYKVPSLIFPQQKEQLIIGARIEKLGCGYSFNEFSSESLRELSEKILKDENIKNNCIKASESLIAAGGYKKAVDEIFKFKTINII